MNTSNRRIDQDRHVVWIGGAARSGKTTVTKWLEARHGFVRYEGDRGAEYRIEHATPDQPITYRSRRMFEAPSLFAQFFERDPDEIAVDLLASGTEEFPYAKRDIDNINAARVAVDAFILRASQVIEVAQPQHVVFLFSTEDFQRELWRKGGWYKNYVGVCRNPEQAAENFVEGIIRQSRMLQAEAEELGCQIIMTGGVKSIDKVFEEIGRLSGFLSSVHTQE